MPRAAVDSQLMANIRHSMQLVLRRRPDPRPRAVRRCAIVLWRPHRFHLSLFKQPEREVAAVTQFFFRRRRFQGPAEWRTDEHQNEADSDSSSGSSWWWWWFCCCCWFTLEQSSSIHFAEELTQTDNDSNITDDIRLDVDCFPQLLCGKPFQCVTAYSGQFKSLAKTQRRINTVIVSSFPVPRMVDGRWPSPGKIWVQRGRPRVHQAVNISPHNSGTVIDSGQIQFMRMESHHGLSNEQSTITVPGSCVTPNFPKMGFRYRNLWFFAKISTKNI